MGRVEGEYRMYSVHDWAPVHRPHHFEGVSQAASGVSNGRVDDISRVDARADKGR